MVDRTPVIERSAENSNLKTGPTQEVQETKTLPPSVCPF